MSSDYKPKTAAQLDEEFNDMIKKMKEKNYKYEDGFTEENIDHILQTHPAFMTKQPTQEDIDNSPLLQGLQLLQYEDDDDTPEQQALAYKEDGNWHFKKNLFKRAVRAYTEGLNKKCSDKALNCTLLANRAAANYYLKNHGSSLKDSVEALKLEPTKVKSMLRCAQCCEALEKYQESITWAEKLLGIETDHSKAKEILSRSQNKLKIAERNRRKKERDMKSMQKKTRALIESIRQRGIRLDLNDIKSKSDEIETLSVEDSLVLSSVDNNNPSHAKVHFEDESLENLVQNGILVWPVLFTYPEHQVSELVEEFQEDSTLSDHLDVMFDDPAPWDRDGHYTIPELEVYFEIGDGGSIVKVSLDQTLKQVLSSGKIKVTAGTPAFIILSKSSNFRKQFLSKYKVIK